MKRNPIYLVPGEYIATVIWPYTAKQGSAGYRTERVVEHASVKIEEKWVVITLPNGTTAKITRKSNHTFVFPGLDLHEAVAEMDSQHSDREYARLRNPLHTFFDDAECFAAGPPCNA